MNKLFAADGTLLAEPGQRLLGRAAIVVGDAAHTDFGGGTLNILRSLESGGAKVIKSYTAVNVVPDVIDGIGYANISAQLTGSTAPDLYVEISQA